MTNEDMYVSYVSYQKNYSYYYYYVEYGTHELLLYIKINHFNLQNPNL